MFDAALNRRLALLETYYATIDAEVRVQEEIISTYEGMISFCPNGEGADPLLDRIDAAKAEIAQLGKDRAEIDRMWNEALLEHEGKVAA